MDSKALENVVYSRLYFVSYWTLSWGMACTHLHGRFWDFPYFLIIDPWNPPPVGHKIYLYYMFFFSVKC